MAARFREMSGRGEPTPLGTTATRPEHVPEKFWDATKGEVNVEALAKSYTELEKTRGTPTPNVAKDGVTIPATPTTEVDPAKAAVEGAGLDWDKVSAEFVEGKGELKAETVESLVKAGIPKAMIDQHIALVKEASANLTKQAVDYVGGEDTMNTLLAWAGQNLTEAEKVSYNTMLATRDQWQVALDTLATKYNGAQKTAGEPKLVDGRPGTVGGGSGPGYQSKTEMMADMSDARYKTDPKFRQDVARKMQTATWTLDRVSA